MVCSVSRGDEGEAKDYKYVIRKFKSRQKVQFVGRRGKSAEEAVSFVHKREVQEK